METKGLKWKLAWDMMWAKHEKEVKEDSVFLTVKKEYADHTVVFDSVRLRTEANVNTHRAIWLRQEENGKLAERELLARLQGKKKLTLTGALSTPDGKPGIAEARLTHGRHEYEIVFTDLPFYSEDCDALFETGGIVTKELVIREDKTVQRDLLCAAGLRVEAGAVFSAVEPATIVFSEAVVRGELRGVLTGTLRVEDGGVVNGNLMNGKVIASGRATLIGMYYGDSLRVEDNAVLRMKEFGSLTSVMDTGKNVTLEFEDAEPLVLTMDPNKWDVNHGHQGGDAGFVGTNTTGQSWYLKNDKTPLDLLGRQWTPELAGGVLMPSMSNIGLMRLEKDLKLTVIGNTQHNFALLMLNRYPIENIYGAIHIHSVEGIACPSVDAEAIRVSEISNDVPYTLHFGKKESAYTFQSDKEIAVQAATKAVVMKRFPDIDAFDWKFALDRETGLYNWYGYEKGKTEEHWDGPTGDEKYTVTLKEEE